MRRFAARATGAAAIAGQTRALHFPLTRSPIPITYLDSDPLEFALRQEIRCYNWDDTHYMRELAFCRINDNPTVGQFKAMTPEERRDMFFGSDRQDFYRWFTMKVVGQPENLYPRP